MLNKDQYLKPYLNLIIKESINNIDYIKNKEIAAEIGGVYDKEINTIDCKQKLFVFKNTWLNDKGSFDFKLVNTSNNWSDMFYNCFKLTYLPDDFTIPEGITDCSYMFYNCESLICLPNNFTMPNSIINCEGMFRSCRKLIHLSDNFNISNNAINCKDMFSFCRNLTHLPNNFTIPNNVEYCDHMFEYCNNLKQMPEGFNIPIDASDEDMFLNCYNLTKDQKDLNRYKMLTI